MKLPTSPTHGPSRGVPRTSGSFSGLSLRNLVSPLGDKAGPAISGTTLERSRTRPWASSMPGFSRPGAPKRTSFIQRLLARYRGFLEPPLPWAGGAGEGFVFVAVNEENQSRRESPFLFPDKRRGQEGAAPGPSNIASNAPRLERDDFSSNRHAALAICLHMIPRVEPEGMLFRKPVPPIGSSPRACFLGSCVRKHPERRRRQSRDFDR